MAKKNKNIKWFCISGILLAIIIGVIIGSQAFPKTEIKYISNDDGRFCFNDNYKNLFEIEDQIFREYVSCIKGKIDITKINTERRLREAIEIGTWNDVILIRDDIRLEFDFAQEICSDWIN